MTTVTTLYAIKQKSTNFYLPQSDRTVRAGFTSMEPKNPSIHPPRLFTRKQDAKCALTWWLKGEIDVDDFTDEDAWGNPITMRGGAGKVHPVEGRNVDDMKIVKLDLIEENNRD